MLNMLVSEIPDLVVVASADLPPSVLETAVKRHMDDANQIINSRERGSS